MNLNITNSWQSGRAHPHDREGMGPNRAKCRAFSFASLSYKHCVLNQVCHKGPTLLIFLQNMLSSAKIEPKILLILFYLIKKVNY